MAIGSRDHAVAKFATMERYKQENGSASRTEAIVFGGAGFIGRHLLRSLVARGVEATCADIRPLQPMIPGVRAVHCDVRTEIPTSLTRAPGSAVVYNLAAVHRTPGHPDREYYDTNVSGALRVTEFCRRTEIKELIFTSSISVYGPSEEEKTERTRAQPESSYGASKLQAEDIHRLWQSEDPKRRLAIARPAVIFGSGENGNFTRLAQALKRRTFMYPGRKDTIKACGYVKELIRSLEFARTLERQYFLFNFCYPHAYTIEEICDAFHDVAGLPRPIGTVPFAPMWLAAAAVEGLSKAGWRSDINRARIDKLVRSTNIRPVALVEAGYQFSTDLRAAIEDWAQETNGALT